MRESTLEDKSIAHYRTAIVTGASSGVGAATGRALAEMGLSVALVARRRERLEQVAAEIVATGGRALPIAADLADAQSAREAMERALDELGSVDVLVSCLGANVPERALSSLSVADWDSTVATNLSAVFYCLHTVLPAMRHRGSGLIVAISSLAGLRPSALSGAGYSAAKAGLNALCRSVNLEETSSGIRTCVIAPGDIDTELLDQRPELPSAEARERMLRPEDIARLVVAVLAQPPHMVLDEIVVYPR